MYHSKAFEESRLPSRSFPDINFRFRLKKYLKDLEYNEDQRITLKFQA